MRCPKCGTQIDDHTRFCDYCGARVREDLPEDYLPAPAVNWKKRLLLLIPVVVLTFVAVGLLVWSPWSAVKKPDATESTQKGAVNGGETDYAVPGILYSQKTANHVVLMMDATDFRVGLTKNANLTIHYPKGYEGEAVILDENDRTVKKLQCDGSGVLTCSVKIQEEEPRLGSFTAKIDGGESSAVLFRVMPLITSEQLQTLVDVCNDLADAVIAEGYSDPTTTETMSFVKKWLEEDARVAQIERHNNLLVFSTVDGLLGAYSGNAETDGNSYGTDSTEDTYEQWQEDPQSVAEVVLTGQGAPTSTKISLYAPDGANSFIAENYPAYRDIFEKLAENAEMKGDFVLGPSAVDKLASAEYTDSALFVLMAHGALLNRGRSEEPMLIYGVESWELGRIPQDELRSMDPGSFYGSVDTPEFAHRLLLVSVSGGEDRTASKRLTLAKTATATMAEIGNKQFDNTIIYYIVCYGADDGDLMQFFFDHGATAFMGAQDQLKDVCASYLAQKLVTVMGSGEDTYSLAQMAQQQYPERLDRELYEHLLNYAAAAGRTDITKEELVEQYINVFTEDPMEICASVPGQYLSGRGTLTCRVQNTSGKPVSEATISLYRWQDHSFVPAGDALTGENGTVKVSDLPYGVYIVVAEGHEALGSRAWNFTPKQQEADPVVLELYSLYGTVTERDTGVPMSGATVTANYGENALMHTQPTDSNGVFRFDYLPGGSLTLRISLEGYTGRDTTVVLDRDVEQNLTVRKQTGYTVGHSNSLYYTPQAPAVSAQSIYYCDGSSIRAVGKDGKKDHQVYQLEEGTTASYLNLDGDWLYYVAGLEINGTMHTAVQCVNVQTKEHKVIWKSALGTMYENVFALLNHEGYVFYAVEKDRDEESWIEIRCIIPGEDTPVSLARFDKLQRDTTEGSCVGFNGDKNSVWIHVNAGEAKRNWILKYDLAELNTELVTDIYDLQGKVLHDHTLYHGTDYMDARSVVLFQEGFLLLGQDSEVYLYEEIAKGLNPYDRLRWDLSSENGSGALDKTLLKTIHCVLEDTLIMPAASGVYVSANGKDANREKLSLKHDFERDEAWVTQDGSAVYMIYKHYDEHQKQSKILLTIFADGTFTETVITK